MSAAAKKAAEPTILSLAQLLEQQPATPPASWIEPGLLPPEGILFVGGEPKVGKSLLVANPLYCWPPARSARAFLRLLRAAC